MAPLTRHTVGTVTLLGDATRPGGVTFAFTERTGGVSAGPFASLNLGASCGDDPACVGENRLRALAALSPSADPAKLINPRQVHGATVVSVTAADDGSIAEARAAARSGADAVAVAVPGVPVLLCYADCVPVVIVADGGFAVVHSGWKGTFARISAAAVAELSRITGAAPETMRAYIGPHITADAYEVDAQLASRFADAFGADAIVGERNLDLSFCISSALIDAGLASDAIVDEHLSTTDTDRFFSYRASGGACGRHGALAIMEA